MVFGTAVVIITIVLGACIQSFNVVFGLESGVLIDFIGVGFIKMYTGTIEFISKFQKSIFDDSMVYFANALTSQITDEALKNQTISDIAKSLVSRNNA